jgi:transposase
MPKSRPAYPPEYRQRIVELARAGRSIKQLARDFEPTETCIRHWVKQADLDAGRRRDGLTSEERAEVAQLRREVRILREEKEILKKAAAWFAQEIGVTPSRRSNS